MGRIKKQVIIYDWKGITCMRSNPPGIKRVPVAIKNSGLFGRASSLSKILRQLLEPILPQPLGNQIIKQRLQEAMRKFLQTEPQQQVALQDDLPCFSGISLNERLDWERFPTGLFRVSRESGNHALLSMEAFDPVQLIKAPANTLALTFRTVTAAMHTIDAALQEAATSEITIPFAAGMIPATATRLAINTGNQKLLIVAITLEYIGPNGPINNPALKPAVIIGSLYN